jgi:aspartate/methionine/tyrosine aminotransferase
MKYVRMPIEVESPEERGYASIRFNLAESSVRDRSIADLGVHWDDLVLAYADHRGRPGLLEQIAERSGAGVATGDILTTAGAAGALFIIATTLLTAEDHLVVVRPNYATNIETPRAIGCEISFVDLAFEDGFALDPERLAAAIRPNTKLISLTAPHNPTGAMPGEAALRRAIAIAEQRGVRILVDETYRDMAFVPQPPLAASLSPMAISVSSVSKTYGIPGVRVGWIVCRDEALMTRFLAAKEQIGICGSVIDERLAEAALAQGEAWLGPLQARLAEGRAGLEAWMAREPRLEWVRPEGGCVCFPRIRADAGVDVAAFHRILLDHHATLVGPGHWFEMDDAFMRIGYGWPLAEELAGGLAAISASLEAAGR